MTLTILVPRWTGRPSSVAACCLCWRHKIRRITLTPQTRIALPSRRATVLSCLLSLMKYVLSLTGKWTFVACLYRLCTYLHFLIVDSSSLTWAVSIFIPFFIFQDNNLYWLSHVAALGTSPGRLVETDAEFNIIHEWPEDVKGTLNILGEQFSPHGLAVDYEKEIILTSDFVVPLSILKPSLGVQRANTLRLWDLPSRKIISTLLIPDVSRLLSMTTGVWKLVNG